MSRRTIAFKDLYPESRPPHVTDHEENRLKNQGFAEGAMGAHGCRGKMTPVVGEVRLG